MHEQIKEKTGITTANCGTCCNLGSDSVDEYSESWNYCEQNSAYENLKSFPFKKEMKCWSPEFWHSKFVDMIKEGSSGEFKRAANAFHEAIENA